jgi:hypothetical protein
MLSVSDSPDGDLSRHRIDFVNDAVVARAHLEEPAKFFSQRLTVVCRRRQNPFLNHLADPFLKIPRERIDVVHETIVIADAISGHQW